MNFDKLHTSFLLLLAMTIVQFLTACFVLHHLLIALLSVIAFALCLAGVIYTNKKNKSNE